MGTRSLAFLAARSIAGVELVENGRYARTIEIDGVFGSIPRRTRPAAISSRRSAFRASRRCSPSSRALRRLFDLDADIQAIGAHLSGDSALAPLIARRPGLRTPGAWCAFELAVRAILGQQITVAGARRLAVRIVELAGSDIAPELSGDERLARVFPSAARLARADLSVLGMPRARIAALGALAGAVAADPKLIEPAGSYDETVARLLALPGFGPWTAQYWALRALRDSDAFPPPPTSRCCAAPLVAQDGRRPTAEGPLGARRILAALARLCRAASVDCRCRACLKPLLLDRVQTSHRRTSSRRRCRKAGCACSNSATSPNAGAPLSRAVSELSPRRAIRPACPPRSPIFRRRPRCRRRACDRCRRHAVPIFRLDRFAEDPRRNHHELRRARGPTRQAGRDARRRPRERRQPDRHCRALSSRRRQRRFADRLWRRPSAQALAARPRKETCLTIR
ncbi:MAG: AlkA N-terminal domain-containing protein [Rhizomicrobium sp.]